jgi:hypothetical protein
MTTHQQDRFVDKANTCADQAREAIANGLVEKAKLLMELARTWAQIASVH